MTGPPRHEARELAEKAIKATDGGRKAWPLNTGSVLALAQATLRQTRRFVQSRSRSTRAEGVLLLAASLAREQAERERAERAEAALEWLRVLMVISEAIEELPEPLEQDAGEPGKAQT